jgi:hypothetical protein
MCSPAVRSVNGAFSGITPLLASYTHYVDVGRLVPVAFFLSIVAASPLWAADRPVRPVIACYGDSITAGNGLEADQAYPAFLQRKLDAAGFAYKVVNEGTSGATTKDALATLPDVLRLRPAIVILEFGGNDGLRGLPVDQSLANLDQILTGLQNAQIRIVFAGITLPPDYGPDYIKSFDRSRHHPGGRHSSHCERRSDHCRHRISCAQADVAQGAAGASSGAKVKAGIAPGSLQLKTRSRELRNV